MRPGVGLSAQMPQKCAGTRMEPPPSLPIPPKEQPAAMAAASPPLEPPEEYAGFHGLLVRPLTRLSVSYAMRNSGVLVLPRRIAPAARRRSTTGAVREGISLARRREPAGTGQSATSMQLFTVRGMPWSGPRELFCAICFEADSAAARAEAASRWTKALR